MRKIKRFGTRKERGWGFFGRGGGSTIRNVTLIDMVLLTNLLTSYEKEHVFIELCMTTNLECSINN